VVGEQADSAAEVEQRLRQAAERCGRARIQRIRAQLRAHIVIVPAAWQEAPGNRVELLAVESDHLGAASANVTGARAALDGAGGSDCSMAKAARLAGPAVYLRPCTLPT